VLKAPADESPIDIRKILDFIDNQLLTADEIRKSTMHLTWKIQMQKVIDAIEL
jgi:hypothetical protein